MFLARSKFLIVVLTLLQTISPFIHAHTGQELANQGLHLYEFEQKTSIHNTLLIQESNNRQFSESFIVCVGQSVQSLKQAPHRLNNFSLPSYCHFLKKEINKFRVKSYYSYTPPPFSSYRSRIFLPRSPPKKKISYSLS